MSTMTWFTAPIVIPIAIGLIVAAIAVLPLLP
jgi:hypothetical protein